MWVELLIVIISLILLHKLKWTRKRDFWEKHGIPSIDISNHVNFMGLLLGYNNILELDKKVYKEMGHAKFCGIIEGGTPVLIVKDLDLAKNILIKDFDHFVNRRGLFKATKSSALQKMLPTLDGHEWRGVRVSISPAFTTGKMRRLIDCFNDCAVEWISSIKPKSGQSINIKSSSSRFATDVIASAVFGLNAGSIQNMDSAFLKNAEKLGDTAFLTSLKQAIALRLPGLMKFLNLNAMNEDALEFFDDILSRALKARESGETKERKDFLQFIVEARKGALKREDEELDNFEKEARLSDEAVLEKNAKQYLLDDEVAKAQGFVFFLAGYHGITMTITYAAHALAYHQDIQRRLREELIGKFDKDGKIGYDDVIHLEFMEMFLSELLRFYPITPRLERVSVKDYENHSLGIKLPKGTLVGIPVAEIHRDPMYYSNPEKFDPEHFSQKSKAKRHSYSYMAYGHGPRNCIGIRFAQVEVKTAIAHLVRNFEIKPVKSSSFPIKAVLVGQGILIPGSVDIELTPISQ